MQNLVDILKGNPYPGRGIVVGKDRGHVIRVEEHEADMYAAIDVAAAKVVRQLRKFKTRVVENKAHSAEFA